MAIVTLAIGGLLSVLGVLGYFMSESRSLTALIPLVFGCFLEACGALALRPELKKHAMHGASVLALLGTLGSIPGVISFVKLLAGETIARPLGAKVQTAMFALCLTLLILCIRSFRAARIRRELERAGVR
jgi:uncharacterized membrane protein HdeD (DUF308 family)